jgi:microcystin-dependent protein
MPVKTGDPINASDFRGLIMMWPNASAPAQWLICNGQAVSRSTYAGLYVICGDIYGAGDGSTTFNLPDLRGSVPIGMGQKPRLLEDVVPYTDIGTGLAGLLVADAKRYGNGKQLTLTAGAGEIFGVNTGWSAFVTVPSSAIVPIGDNPLPVIGTKVMFTASGNTTGMVGLYWVTEIVSATSFRVSATEGGTTITSCTSDGFYWARVEDLNTEGESSGASWNQTGDAWRLGGNTMPVIGDKILCTYESSASPNRGNIYTVSAININGGTTEFYTGNLGSDSGNIEWVNLGQEARQPQSIDNSGNGWWGVYVDDTHIGLATSFANAIEGTILNIKTQGTAEISIEYSDNLSDFSLGEEGGHEEDHISVPEIPAHAHSIQTAIQSGGGLSLVENGNDLQNEDDHLGTNEKGGSALRSFMQPYVTVNFIIKY